MQTQEALSKQQSRSGQARWALLLGQSSGREGGNHYVMIEHWKELVLEWKLGQPVSMVSKPASLNFHPPPTSTSSVSQQAIPCSTLSTHSHSQEAASKHRSWSRETSRQQVSIVISHMTNLVPWPVLAEIRTNVAQAVERMTNHTLKELDVIDSLN